MTGPSPRYQSKNGTTQENPEQPKDDQQRPKIQPPTIKDNPIQTLQEGESFVEHKELPDMRPQQLLVRYMPQWTSATQTKKEMELLTKAKAL
jgi:hypothetical protein